MNLNRQVLLVLAVRFFIRGMKFSPSGLYFATVVTQSRSYTVRFIKI
ncbi:MAG: hypothetical protein NT004_18625 [Bacteroidetes bacterium]|nr:hypothetical protein [Bacteroidota bacterium]